MTMTVNKVRERVGNIVRDWLVDMDSEVDELIDAMMAAFPVLAEAGERKSTAKVVTVSYEASASCSHGVCPSGCSHLMWACSSCSSEGGWGAPRERLEELAAQHECAPVLAEAPETGEPTDEQVCAWCPSLARGSAWHNDGKLHPSCGQIDHGQGWVPEAALSRTAPADEWEYKYAEKLGGTEYTYGDDKGKPFSTLEAAHAARVEDTDYVVRRRKAGPWEKVTDDE